MGPEELGSDTAPYQIQQITTGLLQSPHQMSSGLSLLCPHANSAHLHQPHTGSAPHNHGCCRRAAANTQLCSIFLWYLGEKKIHASFCCTNIRSSLGQEEKVHTRQLHHTLKTLSIPSTLDSKLLFIKKMPLSHFSSNVCNSDSFAPNPQPTLKLFYRHLSIYLLFVQLWAFQCCSCRTWLWVT